MPILLCRAPQVTAEFGLSAGKGHLLAAKPGDAPLLAGGQRAAFHALASPVEHQLITTDPTELAAAGGLTGQEYFDPIPAPRAGEPEDW
jgi:hypothetical protein